LLNKKSRAVVLDCETTGVDPNKNAVVSIAVAVCDCFLGVLRKRSFQMRPHEGAVIDPEALKVNLLTEREIMGYPPVEETLKELNRFLYAACPEKPCFSLWYCWGVGFDDKFLIKSYERAGIKYPGRYTWLCMRTIATQFNLLTNILMANDRTETKNVAKFCSCLDTPFEGAQHDAMADVLNSIKVVKLSQARLMKVSACDSPSDMEQADRVLTKDNPAASVENTDIYAQDEIPF